jgi:hypothetical protein
MEIKKHLEAYSIRCFYFYTKKNLFRRRHPEAKIKRKIQIKGISTTESGTIDGEVGLR